MVKIIRVLVKSSTALTIFTLLMGRPFRLLRSRGGQTKQLVSLTLQIVVLLVEFSTLTKYIFRENVY